MKENFKNLILIVVLLATIGNFIYTYISRPRLAFVRSEILVNEFEGMKEARQVYQQKQQQWQANLDTLRADYNRKERAEAPPEQLRAIAQNMQQYANSIDQLAREEDQKMTQAVLEQINVFVEQYGEEHGYDLLFGTTDAGNILYGQDAIDITEELLTALNHHYNPARYEQ